MRYFLVAFALVQVLDKAVSLLYARMRIAIAAHKERRP
jgi:hypothetical protein